MHPPGFICKAIYKINPWLRLAWEGEERSGPDDELNKGSFCLVQLYHIRDAGTQDNPNTLLMHWEEGPIFNRNGGCSLDWDPIFRVPIYVAKLSDHGFSHYDVFSGRILEIIKLWTTPLKRRIIENRRKLHSDFKTKRNDIIDETTDRLWKEANKPDATKQPIAYKHCKEELKAWERQQEKAAKIEDHFKPKGITDDEF